MEDKGNGVTTKARLDMRLDVDLKEWVREYAKRNGTTVTDLVTNYFVYLRQREEEMNKMDDVARQI